LSDVAVWVVDASVLLKWLLPTEQEDHVLQANAIRNALLEDQIRVILPELWRFEVGNTLCRLMPEHAQELLALCLDLGIQTLNSDQWVNTAVRLATTYSVTFYDASYHAVAKTLSGTLVTADQRYVNKVLMEGQLIHLKDWV
jgi:predicted nucleic acid-binding protein